MAAFASKSKGLIVQDNGEDGVKEGAKTPVLYSTLAETHDWEAIADMNEEKVVYFSKCEDFPLDILRKLKRLEVRTPAPLPSRDWEETLDEEAGVVCGGTSKSADSYCSNWNSKSEGGEVARLDQKIIGTLGSDLGKAIRSKGREHYNIKCLISRLRTPGVTQAQKTKIGEDIRDAMERKKLLDNQICDLRTRINAMMSSCCP